MSIAANTPRSVDVGAIVDDGDWTASRKGVLILCALAIVLDGLDNQILGFAIPSMIAEWQVSRGDFAPALALGYVGMTIGTPIGGLLGDRIGRKATLILCVILFGLATAVIGLAQSPSEVSVYRFIGGLGLGGALPAATTLIAEFTPQRRRSLSVLLGLVCIPVGGMIGGLLAAELLPQYGWRMLFFVSGIAPLVVAVFLMWRLPESPQYLLAKGAAPDRIVASVARMGVQVSPEDRFIDSRRTETKPSLGALFQPGFTRSTLAMWVAFFFCLLPVYVIYAWTATLLTSNGFRVETASFALALFNFGGIAGCIVAGWAIGRFGSRAGMLTMTAAAAIAAAALALLGITPENGAMVMIALTVLGFFLLGAQGSLYALAAQIYPSQIRSTGLGAAAGVGRAGAIISAYVGAAALGMGSSSFFGVIGCCLVLTVVALTLVNLHFKTKQKKLRCPIFRPA